MAEEIEIELTDHIGTGLRGERVEHGQWIVRADGQQIGYLPKCENAWLACIVSMDKAQQAEVMAAVNRKLGREIRGVSSLPPVREQELLDGDEDDEIEDEWS